MAAGRNKLAPVVDPEKPIVTMTRSERGAGERYERLDELLGEML